VFHPGARTFASKLLVAVLVACPFAFAQRHGGAAGGGMTGLPSGASVPSGIQEQDSLKDFHEAMAVQATAPQVAAFQELVKSTDAAKAELKAFLEQQTKAGAVPGSASAGFDQALEAARAGNRKFVDGFSPAQKAGLREPTKRLDKADSDLDDAQKKLEQISAASASNPELLTRAQSLEKTLEDFADQQLAVGREMGITLAMSHDVSFTLPALKSTIRVEDQAITVPVSGLLTQLSAEQGRRIFKLELNAGLPDLQQNITDILRARFDDSGQCGEKLEVRQARLSPASPASVLALVLHYERWVCARPGGPSISSELAESDGRVELKLTPVMEKSNAMKLTAEFQRIDAAGMMGDSLRSGDLGDDLKARISEVLLPALEAGIDFKTVLPRAVQGSATLEEARFLDAGAGNLSIVVDGQAQISDEQATALASELNRTLSAKGAPAK